MNIEEEIFKNTKFDFKALELYGFKKNKTYDYEINFMDNQFKAVINIDKTNAIKAKVYDTDSNEEYLPIRVKYDKNPYSNTVKNKYIGILKDIKKKCEKLPQRNRIYNLIFEKYETEPDYPWEKYKDNAVFRNKKNNKWFALFMNIDEIKLDKTKKGALDVVNIKLDKDEIIELIKQQGFYPAYHMNKKSWITIVLNDTLDDKTIIEYINKSYSLIS